MMMHCSRCKELKLSILWKLWLFVNHMVAFTVVRLVDINISRLFLDLFTRRTVQVALLEHQNTKLPQKLFLKNYCE